MLRGDEIAMVFQDPMTAFNPVLTIGDQLVDFQHHRRDLSRRAEEGAHRRHAGAASASPMPARRMASYPHELSGGMRQRVAIAAALLTDPGLLIADEPTTALDVTMEAQIIHLLRELRREFNGIIIVVSHHLGVIAELCDRVYVMYAGEVVEDGDVDAIFHDARHPYTQALLACDPARFHDRLDRLPTIPGTLPSLMAPPAGCVYAPAATAPSRRAGRPRPHRSRCRPRMARDATRCTHDAAARRRGPVGDLRAGRADQPAAQSRAAAGLQHHRRRHARARCRARRWGWSANPAPARRRWRAPSSGWCKAATGTDHASRARMSARRPISAPCAASSAMMFQDPVASLSPRLRVGTLLTEPLVIQGVGDARPPRARRKALLAQVGLPASFVDRYPHELSGGQARRVGVARALSMKPQLLLADEPTAGLDVSVQGDMLNLIAELKRELGFAAMIVTHNLAMIRHVSDRLAIMYLGRLVETGPTQEVFAAPMHPYTATLIQSEPVPDPRQRRASLAITRRDSERVQAAVGLRVPHALPDRARALPDRGAGLSPHARRPHGALPFPARDGRARTGSLRTRFRQPQGKQT